MSELRSYQKDGAFFLTHKRRALLADDMGLGKTAQAATALSECLDRGERGLVICPASLKINWQRELATWAPDIKTGIATPQSFPNDRVVIINYNILKRHHKVLRERDWQVGICDEAHCLKTLDSQRTKEVRGGFKTSPIRIDTRWALTGTPIINRPIELYPILKWLEVPWAPKELVFGKRYCGGYEQVRHYGNRTVREWIFSGSSNQQELRQKLRGVMLRRLKGDVLGELPPKTRQIIELDYNAEGKAAIAEEWRALRTMFPGKSFESIAGKLMSPELHGLSLDIITGLRKKTAMAKLDSCADHIEMLLEHNDKLVIFGYHHDVVSGLISRLKHHSHVSLTGETPLRQRQMAVDKFQNDPDCRLFFGNLLAAGVGITLTSAYTVVFIEEDWTPGAISQAEDRVHRFGQLQNVLCQHLVLDGSLDAHMVKMQIAKQEVIDEIIN